MSFVYHDEKWLVVDKPASISTHKSHAGDLGLAEWLRLHHGIQVYICSRLDKETSGVLVFALTPEASGEAQVVHEKNQALKTYFFIAKSCEQETWVCTESLDGKLCKTVFTQVERGRCYSLYKAEIHRGRTHQIRRHASLSSLPILGDSQYGGDRFVRLCLHCETVRWPDMEAWQSLLPPWFSLALQGLSLSVKMLALVGNRYPFLASVTDSCRLVHRGETDIADIAIDKYGDYVCVTGFDGRSAQETFRQLEPLLYELSRVCGCRGGVVKTNRRDPHKQKLFADLFSWGDTIPDHFFVKEHGLQFGVSFNVKQHIGLFLDQRDSRQRIVAVSQGARVANLFAFTCSFSLYALDGGAKEVFSVDLAAGCLKRGKENLRLNGLGERGISRFIKEDVRKWLARQVRKKQRNPAEFEFFDLVVCDPPVFASAGKGKRFQVEKEWQRLAQDVAEILTDTGVALFANNHQAGQDSYYLKGLQQSFSRVTRLNPPLDFLVLKGQPTHIRIYWCEK